MIENVKKNSEIVAIPNRYKDTLNNLIDNSDAEFSDWLRLNNKGLRNLLKSKSSLMRFLKRDYLDKDVPDRSSWLAFKIRDS